MSIQEWCRFPPPVYDMFPGTPEVRDGYMYPNDRLGLEIDVDEELAARSPCRGEGVGLRLAFVGSHQARQ